MYRLLGVQGPRRELAVDPAGTGPHRVHQRAVGRLPEDVHPAGGEPVERCGGRVQGPRRELALDPVGPGPHRVHQRTVSGVPEHVHPVGGKSIQWSRFRSNCLEQKARVLSQHLFGRPRGGLGVDRHDLLHSTSRQGERQAHRRRYCERADLGLFCGTRGFLRGPSLEKWLSTRFSGSRDYAERAADGLGMTSTADAAWRKVRTATKVASWFLRQRRNRRWTVRIEKLLRTLLGLEGTRVLDVNFDEAGLVVDVAPTWRNPRCAGCGQPGP